MKRFLSPVLLALTLSATAFAGGTYTWPAPLPPPDVNPATAPVFPIARWLNAFEQNMQNCRALGQVDLIFDGDQLTIGKDNYGHPAPLMERFGKLRAYDFASNGDPIQTVLWRLQNGQVDGLHPKLVALLLGSGNLQTNTPEEIAAGVKAVVQEYQKRCPDAVILLEGVFPRREKPTEPLRVKIKAINQLIAPLGDGQKVIYLDFSDKFLQPDGTMTKEMFNDFSFPHPSPGAYKIWADAIQPVIDKYVPPAPAGAKTAASLAQSTSVAGASPTATPPVIGGGTVTWPSAPVPPGGNTALIPEPPLGWLNQFQKKIDTSRKMKSVDLLFDGDSITAGWMGGGGGTWHKRYGNLNAFDFGNSGDVTQGLMWQVENGQVDGLHPKLICLLIGTNNLGHGTPQDIADGIKAVIDEYQKHCPGSPILLQGIFPRGQSATEPARDKIKAINKIISKFADGKNVLFIDFGDKLLQPDGTISKDILGDYLHPSAKGYQIWADAIQPIIDQYLPPSEYPSPTPAPAKPAPAAKASPK